MILRSPAVANLSIPNDAPNKCYSVYQAFAEVARRNATRTAIEWQGQRISYGELLGMAHRLAAEIGLCNDAPTPIGVLADNSPHQVAAYVAASFCCRPYAPLSPAYPQPMLQELVDRFEITILVHDRLSAAQAGELRVSFRLNAERLTRGEPASGGTRPYRSPERAAWHYVPDVHLWLHWQAKGVSIPYRAIRNLVASPDYVELGPHDRVAYVANPAFDASLFEIWGALLNGATLVHLARRDLPDPDVLAEFLRDRRISIVFLTTGSLQSRRKAQAVSLPAGAIRPVRRRTRVRRSGARSLWPQQARALG